MYNGIPHLLAPVIVETDRVVGVLHWITREMDRRYRVFAAVGARNLDTYNATAQAGEKLPNIVVLIDELADLMLVASDEVEKSICRIAQMSRATGIHLVIATQRPSVDVVTGLIKANFAARLAFAVTSQVDSRVILDNPGAERLLGRGDALFMSPGSVQLARLQACWVTDAELSRLVNFWKAQLVTPSIVVGAHAPEPSSLVQQPLWPGATDDQTTEKQDPLLAQAQEIVQREGRASVSLLQRRLGIGYTRASRLVDALEAAGVVGAASGSSKPREVITPSSDSIASEQENT